MGYLPHPQCVFKAKLIGKRGPLQQVEVARVGVAPPTGVDRLDEAASPSGEATEDIGALRRLLFGLVFLLVGVALFFFLGVALFFFLGVALLFLGFALLLLGLAFLRSRRVLVCVSVSIAIAVSVGALLRLAALSRGLA